MPEVKEPTVSVHGVPQSQYQGGSVPGTVPAAAGGGGGLKGNLQRNWALYLGVVGVIVVIIIIYYYFTNSSSSPSSGGGGGGTGTDAGWQDNVTSMLNQIIAGQQSGGSSSKSSTKHYASIKYGETLNQFAEAHGFASWQQLANEFGNAQLVQGKTGKNIDPNKKISSLFGFRLRIS